MLSQRRDQGDEIRPVYEMGEPSASFFFFFFFVKSESKLKRSDHENHCTCLWLF